MSNERDEGVGIIFWYILAAGAAVIILGLLIAILKPTFLGFEREAVQDSRQYQVTVAEALQRHMEAYNDAAVQIAATDNQELKTTLHSQQLSALRSMEAEFNKLGGIDAVQGEPEFQVYIEFFNQHSNELGG